MPQSIGKIVRSWIWDFDIFCGSKKRFSRDLFIFLRRFWRSLEFESWNLEFGFWVLEFRFRLASTLPAKPNFAQVFEAYGPRGNSRQFFFAFWNVMGNPMNGTEKNKKK